jgi:hypothetical protein
MPSPIKRMTFLMSASSVDGEEGSSGGVLVQAVTRAQTMSIARRVRLDFISSPRQFVSEPTYIEILPFHERIVKT